MLKKILPAPPINFMPSPITITGLRIASPCAKCFYHLEGIPKNTCQDCAVCPSRIQYDAITSLGWTVVPFINERTLQAMAVY